MKEFLEKRYSTSGVSIVMLGLLFILSHLFAGFFNTMGSDLYNTSKQAIQNSTILTLQIIGIIIVIGGFCWMGYGYWRTNRNGKKHELQEFDDASDIKDPKRKRKRDWKHFPSNQP